MYKQFFAIEKRLKAQGVNIDRAELIEDFTDGKKSSLKSLTAHEYKELIIKLTNLNPAAQKPNNLNSPENRMRRKMIAIFVHQMGYTMEELNNWCLNYGKFNKELNDHTASELIQLINQAEKVLASHIKSIAK